jgi:predicted nucleic acid-binding protein
VPYLADTNILLRSISSTDPQYAITRAALAKIRLDNDVIYITSQNLIEFRHVATRPVAANGLGWTAPQASTVSVSFEAQFDYLPDIATIFTHWKALVDATGTDRAARA